MKGHEPHGAGSNSVLISQGLLHGNRWTSPKVHPSASNQAFVTRLLPCTSGGRIPGTWFNESPRGSWTTCCRCPSATWSWARAAASFLPIHACRNSLSNLSNLSMLSNFVKKCQTLSKHAKLCQKMSNFVKTCQTLSNLSMLSILSDLCQTCQTCQCCQPLSAFVSLWSNLSNLLFSPFLSFFHQRVSELCALPSRDLWLWSLGWTDAGCHLSLVWGSRPSNLENRRRTVIILLLLGNQVKAVAE